MRDSTLANVGGTPFESASQNDEPAMDFLNALDLDASAVGNHEFDQGAAELLRQQRGGCCLVCVEKHARREVFCERVFGTARC